MQTELKIKDWRVETRDNKQHIAGTYLVMLGNTKIAEQTFNNEYGGTPITFERELQDAATKLTNDISESIAKSFTN